VKRVHAYYSGRVQGVGFRFTAVDLALKYKVCGWVKNLPDSRVEVVAEGEEKNLDCFLADLKTQMSHYISEENMYTEPATKDFSNFRIQY